jgi:hypothetical protein
LHAIRLPSRARLARQDLAATAAPFARSIDRHLAQHDLKTSRAAPVTSKGVTLSDEKDRKNARRPADMAWVVTGRLGGS